MGTPGDKANVDEIICESLEEIDSEYQEESLLHVPLVQPIIATTTGEQSAPSTSNMTVITSIPHFSTFVDYSADASLPQIIEETVPSSTSIHLEQASIEEYFAQSKYYPVSSESFQQIHILPRPAKTFLSIAEPGPSGLQSFKAKPTEASHKRTKYLVPTQTYVCTICQKVFHNHAKLVKHQLGHNGKSPFKCEHCRKTFSSRFKLVRHILIHSDRKPFSCSVCDRTFHRKDHLKNHIKVHSPSKKHYICEKPMCKKEYTSLLSFKKHTALHAAEEGSLVCQICSKTFETRDDILYHLKIHAGSRTVKNPSEKKFTCDYCDRKFFTRKDVRRHLVVHTGMRDFLCQFCPQRFGRKDHLVRHIKKSHSRSFGSVRQPIQVAIKEELLDPIKLEVLDAPVSESDTASPSVKLEHKIDISDLDLFYSEEYGEFNPLLPSTSEQLHFLPSTSADPEFKDLEPIVLDEIVETSSIGSLSPVELIGGESVETSQLLEEPVLSDTEIMRLLESTDEQNLPLPGFSQTFQSQPPPPPPSTQ